MQHRNSLTRAKQIIEARTADLAAAASIEQSIAMDLLGPDTIARDAVVRPLAHTDHTAGSSMLATEAFAHALEAALTTYAIVVGVKDPKPGKYDPLFATPTLFREVWLARQVVDELGIPYDFYCEHAVGCWIDMDAGRMPRPSRLVLPDIAGQVMALWAAHYKQTQQTSSGLDSDVAATPTVTVG